MDKGDTIWFLLTPYQFHQELGRDLNVKLLTGFSEFDSFRSNQIREGLITREEAIELLKDDNRLRIETLQDFSQLIGFNLEEVLLKINMIPKLCEK